MLLKNPQCRCEAHIVVLNTKFTPSMFHTALRGETPLDPLVHGTSQLYGDGLAFGPPAALRPDSSQSPAQQSRQ